MINPKVDNKKKKLSLKAAYDAAKTTNQNIKHWSQADFLSADLDANFSTRQIIRSRARYEVQNNSIAKGIASTLANDCIGSGARIQVNCDDVNQANAIEKAFTEWAKEIKLAEKLKTARYSKLVDGEAFILLTTNDKINNQIKLDVQLIEADRITGQGMFNDAFITDGIKVDSQGNVVSYSVLDYHPSEKQSTAKEISAENIIHLYNIDRPGQHRGISELAPALNLFGQLRDYTAATLTAAQVAASITGAIETDSPAGGESEQIEPLEAIDLAAGQIITLPAGWKLQMNKAEQPTSTYKDFKNELISEIARCLNLPYNIAKCDSQNASYASSRLDTQIYFKTVKLEQQYFIRNCLDVIFKNWLKEYTLRSKITLKNFEYSYMFEMGMIEHSDPLKLATSQAISLQNCTTTLAEIYADKGRNYEKELRQIAYERKLMKELDLTFKDLTNEQYQMANQDDLDQKNKTENKDLNKQ